MAPHPDCRLIEAVNSAMFDAAEEAGIAAIDAAIRGEEVTSNPAVLLHAIHQCADEIQKGWYEFVEGAEEAAEVGHSARLDDARLYIETMTDIAYRLLHRALEASAERAS
jgi:hypothetical protein